ncbi:hypothetical protein Tco_0272146, partial [Tanacetum coccineum]
ISILQVVSDSDDDISKDGVFSTNSFDAEEGGVADYNNMDPTIDVPSTPTLRIHKIHPQSQIIGKSTAGVQTRRKLQDSTSNQHQALLSFIYKQNRTNHKDQQTCLFACFLSQEELKKENVSQAFAFQELKQLDSFWHLNLSWALLSNLMDVKKCIFVWQITEEVYVKQPSGFDDLLINKFLQNLTPIEAHKISRKKEKTSILFAVLSVCKVFKSLQRFLIYMLGQKVFSDFVLGDHLDRSQLQEDVNILGRGLVSCNARNNKCGFSYTEADICSSCKLLGSAIAYSDSTSLIRDCYEQGSLMWSVITDGDNVADLLTLKAATWQDSTFWYAARYIGDDET